MLPAPDNINDCPPLVVALIALVVCNTSPDSAAIVVLPARVIAPEAVAVPLPEVSSAPPVPAAPVPVNDNAFAILIPPNICKVALLLTVTPLVPKAVLFSAIRMPLVIVVPAAPE